jgi:hypothetical protein
MLSDFGQEKSITCHHGNYTSRAIFIHDVTFTFLQLGSGPLLVRPRLPGFGSLASTNAAKSATVQRRSVP